MKHIVHRSLIGLVCLGLAAVGLAAPAQAADGAAALSVTGSASTLAPSEYLAGYTANAKGNGVTKTMTVPDVTCPNNKLRGIALGIGDEAVEGQPVLLGVVFVACSQGQPVYLTQAFVAGGTAEAGAAAAGDKIKFAVKYAGGNATVDVTNLTDAAGTVTATGAAPKAKLHFGAFPLFNSQTGDKVEVPDFGSVKMNKNQADGKALTGMNATKYDRIEGGEIKINTSKIRRGSFSLEFKNN